MIPAYVIVEGIESLPTLPEAVARLTVLMQDDKSTAADFERAVRSDPVTTANLLRAANSVFYQGIEPTTSVSQAVARIGLLRVFEVAIGSSFRRTLPARIPGYGLTAPAFWLHCTATAVYAEALVRELNLPCGEMAFTAGLLHDVGKLVIGGFLAEMMPESNWWTFGTAAEERKMLGSNHCDVGKEIAIRWNLPLSVVHACRWHHEPGAMPDDVDSDLMAVVNAADYLSCKAGFSGGTGEGESCDSFILERLGLTPDRSSALADMFREEVLEMNKITSGMSA
jgi:putative nucleotidyltransferase with HDIG domain